MINIKNDVLALGRSQAQMFQQNNIAFCEVLVTCTVPRQILLSAYYQLVRREKILALEDMLYQDQVEAGAIGKDIAKGRLERKELKDVIRALIAINYFLEL